MTDTDLQTLLAGLLDPAAYRHPVGRIELIETHVSYLLLTGDYAYKIKKPLDLEFLDYGSLDKRRFFCAEEVRLNRRLAPEIYLGVAAIGGTLERPAVEGEGPALEYAVKMRQFPQDALLDRMLAAGELAPSHVDQLAEAVAAFHRQAPRATGDDPFGRPENVLEPARQNFRQIRPALADPLDRQRLQAVEDWTEAEFAARIADFTGRRQGGFVRECHGDLHLGNLTLLDGRIVPFDCIEFSPNLRWIDVMSELAFAVMDLHAREREGYARRLLDRYLQLAGDYAGLTVFRFYLAYRAMVRAKVACIRAAQPGLDAGEKRGALGTYRDYCALAEQFSADRKCVLILTHGLSGAGKTTLSQPLLEAVGAVRLRSDVERKRLFGLAPLADSGSGIGTGLYTEAAGDRSYERLADLARILLRAGYPAIVDATFLRRARRDAFRGLAETLRVPFVILDFHASEAALRRRIAERQRQRQDASEADLAVLQHQIESRDPLAPDELDRTIALDTERPDAASQALTALRRQLAPC